MHETYNEPKGLAHQVANSIPLCPNPLEYEKQENPTTDTPKNGESEGV